MPIAADLYYFEHPGTEPYKPPVVLIHGAGGTHLYWPPEIRRLTGPRVFALDLPGHGRSSGVGRQSVTDYTQCVLAFMDAIGLSRAFIVGHSMGGAISLTIALDQPDRLVGLGLIATGARLRVAPAVLESASNPATLPLAIKTIGEWAFGPEADMRLVEMALKRMNEIRPAVFYGDLLACDSFDVIGRLEQVRIPTLILCGTEDKMTPLRYSEYLATNIPGAALQTLASAGHMAMLEQPRRVAGLLSIFLETVPYQPGS